MTSLGKTPFSSKPATAAYRDNWDATFGSKRDASKPEPDWVEVGPGVYVDPALPSRSVQRRKAAMKGDSAPTFEPGTNVPRKR